MKEIIRSGNVKVTEIPVTNINNDILKNYRNKDVKFEKEVQNA